MKKIFTLVFMIGLSLIAKAQLTDGFYHVKNTYTNRYIYMNDDSKGTTSVATGPDASAVRSSRNKEFMFTHPGAVVLITSKGGGLYDVAAQGTSFGQLTGGRLYPQLERQPDGTYRFHGSYEGMDYTFGDLSRDREDGWMLEVIKGTKNSFWQLLPIDNKADGEFLGLKPDVQTADGSWWGTIYTGFPFSLESEGMVAYYVDKVSSSEFKLKELGGKGTKVAGYTPVVIKCASEDYAKNIVRPLTSSVSELTDNKLKGVFFDSSYKSHVKRTTYDKKTMRVIGVNANKELVFKTAGEEDLTDGAYLRHNKAYLEVSSGSAETIVIEGGTGIHSIQVNTEVETTKEGTYNLAGQRTEDNPTAPGVYIKDGKKVIVR